MKSWSSKIVYSVAGASCGLAGALGLTICAGACPCAGCAAPLACAVFVLAKKLGNKKEGTDGLDQGAY